MLARQATERLPVSRTYLPSLFVNLVGRRRLAVERTKPERIKDQPCTKEKSGLSPALSDLPYVLRLEAQVHTHQQTPAVAGDGSSRTRSLVQQTTAGELHARPERVVDAEFPLLDRLLTEGRGSPGCYRDRRRWS